MEILLLGIASSMATEIVTWIDAKLSGTVFKGDGALILSAVIAFLFSAIKVFSGGVSFGLTDLAAQFGQIWAMSQVFFLVVVQSLHLDVSSSPTS